MSVKKWRWGVILDAGSSGTRLHIYKWKDPARALKDADSNERSSLPELKTDKKWTKKIRPGVSTFGEHPKDVGPDHLRSLVEHALDVIPEEKVQDTPIFLMATAGMRLLPQVEQAALTREICLYLRKNTQFSLPDCGLHIQVIPGETEGLYGWLAANYLLGGFDRPDEHQHGKGHHTYGFLDMGGASAQIAFAPNSTEVKKHANDLKLVRLRTLNGAPLEYKVFTATWLGFGVNQAREAYVKGLQEAYGGPGLTELPDPCLPTGLRTTLEGTPITGAHHKGLTLLGTGAFDECLRRTHPLLGKDAPCLDEPCLLNGQHVPAIDFDVNHFVGVSEYWHTTHGVFGDEKPGQAYDFMTYQKKVKQFCSQDWTTIAAQIGKRKNNELKYAHEACFKASWLINVLHEGIGIPRIVVDKTPPAGLNASKGAIESAKENGFIDPFQPVDKIHGIEVSWTLGKMLLYAAGQIPPQTGDDSLPVGFGANVAGIAPDFQVAGSSWKPTGQESNGKAHDDDDDWSDTAEELLDKAKSKSASGLMVFVLVLIIVAYVFRKRERRVQLYGRVHSLVRSPARKGTSRRGSGRVSLSGLTSKLFGGGRHGATYERVLEDGEADRFELGDVDSSDGENHSDSSEGSRHTARSSGLATPKINVEMFDYSGTGGVGSGAGGGGLIARTESRERLVAGGPGGAGRRSRTGSPTRKSPQMSPLRED